MEHLPPEPSEEELAREGVGSDAWRNRCDHRYPDLARCWLPPVAHLPENASDPRHDADWRPHAFVEPER